MNKGVIYIAKFNKRPIYCMFTPTGVPVAVFYNKVAYLLNNTGTTSVTKDVKAFYDELRCNTKVYLYRHSGLRLFIDEQGSCGCDASMNKSFACDYKDVIPLPSV